MADIESRVRDYRQEIFRCIKEPTIVSYLEASSVITNDDGSRLKTMYHSGETTKAGEEMLACIIASKEPGKWTSFIDALENADYPYLKELLLCSNPEANNARAEHAKTVLRLFTPKLERSLIPQELIPWLQQQYVINLGDIELILATLTNRGTTAASSVLLERIQCRLSPEQWYKEFLGALMKSGHEFLVQSMEPEYIADPTAFGLLQDTLLLDSNTGSFDDYIVEGLHETTNYTDSSEELADMETKAEVRLRNFQLELADIALRGQNSIICAETGSGKTMIALHIIQKHLLDKSTDDRSTVLFMARTDALISQICEMIKSYMPQYRTRLILNDQDKLEMFADSYDIVCFTPTTLVHYLESHASERLSQFSLIVFDECHHIGHDEPYSMIMRKYIKEKDEGKVKIPQVVGLTSSFGIGTCKSVPDAVDHILRVCAFFDTRQVSNVERNIKELRQYVQLPFEDNVHMALKQNDPSREVIFTAIQETEIILKDIESMQEDLKELVERRPSYQQLEVYIKWTTDVLKAATLVVDNYDVTRNICCCAKYLHIYITALEMIRLLPLGFLMKYLEERQNEERSYIEKLTETEKRLLDKLQDVQNKLNVNGNDTENPNARVVCDILSKRFEEDKDGFRAIVIVKAKATSKSLAEFFSSNLDGVVTTCLNGDETRGGEDGMTESGQTKTLLQRFRDGVYNTLVCTSVEIEGRDIVDCSIVLTFEYSSNMISQIQRSGPARRSAIIVSDEMVKHEILNLYDASKLYKALNEVKKMDSKYIDVKVTLLQKQETHLHRFKTEVERIRKGNQTDEDYEILCRRCNSFACLVSDVRQMGNDHIVIDKAFEDKITREEQTMLVTNDGMDYKYNMFCKKCPLDWGMVGLRDGLDCWILNIQRFKFRNRRTLEVNMYEKWADFPCRFLKQTTEDLILASLPEEILKMDDNSVQLYKKALKGGKEEINTIRVMIVGQCGVGKTTLTKRLFGEQVDIAHSMTRTNGIEVHSKRCKVLLTEREWQPTKTENSEETIYNRIFSLMKNISNEAKLKREEAKHENKDEENASATETKIIEQKDITGKLPANLGQKPELENELVLPPVHKKRRVAKEAVTILRNEDLKSLGKKIDAKVQLTDLIHDVVKRSTFEHNRNIADLSIWDFAGQYVFYATHQIFLSRRAIYLLVTDLTQHLDNPVQDDCFVDSKGRTDCKMSEFVTFWLNSIHTFCESGKKGEPPVILVGTFADKLPKEKREDISDEFFTTMRETLAYSDAFEHLCDAKFAIDNSIVDPNLEKLKKMIVDIATKQSYWSELYPTRWVVLERSLMIFKRQGLKILPKRILEHASRDLPHPIDNEELELFLRFHHETGYILYFSEENLKDHIILEPQWLVDALKSFITARQFCAKKSDLCRMWMDFNNTAILKKDLIDAVWSDETPFQEHQDLILDYMEKLAIISRPMQSLESGYMLEDFYFAPCFLKKTVPDKLLETDEQNCKSTSRLCFTTPSRIIPVQLFNKLLAECIRKWPISKQNDQYLIFCGCAVFDVANLHVLYIYLRDSVIQIWITKFSKSETEPDIDVCSDAKAFIIDSLNTGSNVSSKLEIYVVCQESSFKTTENMFKVDNMSQKEECLCNSHDRRHVVSKSTLLKCWFPEQFEYQSAHSDEFFKNVPTEKDLSRLAKRIGKEYRTLGIELGLTRPELDHVEMEERTRTSVDIISAMLSEWAKKKSDEATFQELRRAMVETGIDWKFVFGGLK